MNPGAKKTFRGLEWVAALCLGWIAKGACVGFPFKASWEKVLLRLSVRPEALGSLEFWSPCLFVPIWFHHLLFNCYKGWSSWELLQRGLPLVPARQGWGLSFGSEPSPRPKHLPTQNITAKGMALWHSLCPGPDPPLGRVLRGSSCIQGCFPAQTQWEEERQRQECAWSCSYWRSSPCPRPLPLDHHVIPQLLCPLQFPQASQQPWRERHAPSQLDLTLIWHLIISSLDLAAVSHRSEISRLHGYNSLCLGSKTQHIAWKHSHAIKIHLLGRRAP